NFNSENQEEFNAVAPDPLPEKWEEVLLSSISKVRSQKRFPEIYDRWKSDVSPLPAANERYEWLKCIQHYVNSGEWTAIVDEKPSHILYPIDVDQTFGIVTKKTIPSIFRIPSLRPQTSLYQKELFNKYGILAVDHTDQQSPIVLKE